MYMKFQELLMTGSRDMDKNHQKYPKFPNSPIWDTKDFFQKLSLVTYVPLRCPNFMQKNRKNQGALSEIFKDWRTDGPTDGPTDKGDY